MPLGLLSHHPHRSHEIHRRLHRHRKQTGGLRHERRPRWVQAACHIREVLVSTIPRPTGRFHLDEETMRALTLGLCPYVLLMILRAIGPLLSLNKANCYLLCAQGLGNVVS